MRMVMRVDEAGDRQPAGRVDGLDAARLARPVRQPRAEPGDHAVLDQDVLDVGRMRIAVRRHDAGVGDQQAGWRCRDTDQSSSSSSTDLPI